MTTFLVNGGIHWASSRIRGYWTAMHMPGAKVAVASDGIPEDDVYVCIKVGDPALYMQMKQDGKKIILDLCDPAWWMQPDNIRIMVDVADAVTFSNVPLMQDFLEFYGATDKAHCIPDRIYLDAYPIKRKHIHDDTIRLIWFGASQNRVGIFATLPMLDRLICNGVQCSLTICDDQPENQWGVEMKLPVYYVKWTLPDENRIIASHDIALVPPYPGKWGAIKSNNKTLTAWACGLPATDCYNWDELYTLATSTDERQRQANAGWEIVKDGYDSRQSARDLQRLIDRIAG